MHTTMDVGIIMPIVVFDGLNHSQRLLRGGRVIEINQLFPVNALVKGRKVTAHFLDIESRRRGLANDVWSLGCDCHPTSSNALSAGADRSPTNFAVSGSDSA